jgi:hypothetical protein
MKDDLREFGWTKADHLAEEIMSLTGPDGDWESEDRSRAAGMIEVYGDDQLDKAAKLVLGWHIKKGGYEALAHAIEELRSKP